MLYFQPENGGHSRELRVEEVLEWLPVPRETLIKWLEGKELKGRRIAERKGWMAGPRSRPGVVH